MRRQTEAVPSQVAPNLRPLEDEELSSATGGLVVIAIIAILIGLLVPA